MFLLLFTFFTSPASASNLLSSFCFKVSIVRLRPSASIVPALTPNVNTKHLWAKCNHLDVLDRDLYDVMIYPREPHLDLVVQIRPA